MKIPHALTAVAIVACSALGPVWGQVQSAIAVQDQSAPGSPLAISGSVSFSETLDGDAVTYSHGENITARNISSQPILAVALSIRLVLPHGERRKHAIQFDYFFKPDLILPGDTLPISWPRGEHRTVVTLRDHPQTTEPHAEVQVLYAQFPDGSAYGGKEYGERILSLRSSAWETLRRLDRIYRTQGPEEFLKVLNQPVEPHDAVHVIVKDLLSTADQAGPAEAELKLQRMLAIAAQHQEMLDEPAK